MKKKGFYIWGTLFGFIDVAYFAMVYYMVLTKSENLTAVAIVGAIIPLVGSIGSLCWLVAFLSKLSAKAVSIRTYLLPFVLTGLSTLILVGGTLMLRVFA